MIFNMKIPMNIIKLNVLKNILKVCPEAVRYSSVAKIKNNPFYVKI